MTHEELQALYDRLDEAERILSDCRTAISFRSRDTWIRGVLSEPIDAYFKKYYGGTDEQERRRSGAV